MCEPNSSSPVCVVGMHRSGTSSLAASLEEAGLYLGEVNRSAPWNTKGNHESRALMELHDDVLTANGGSWDDPPLSVTWQPEHLQRLRDHLATYPAEQVWGFKDPRALIVLNGWQRVLPDLRFVGTVRHPAEVVASLQRRSRGQGELERWLWLWTQYNRRLLELHQAHSFPVVNFNAPPAEYRRQLQKAAASLGLTPPINGFSFFEDRLRTSPRAQMLLDDATGLLYQSLLERVVQ